jgi:hypothetical protein
VQKHNVKTLSAMDVLAPTPMKHRFNHLLIYLPMTLLYAFLFAFAIGGVLSLSSALFDGARHF